MTMSVKMLAEIAAHAQAMADEAQAMATAMQAVVNDCAEQMAAKQGTDAINTTNGATDAKATATDATNATDAKATATDATSAKTTDAKDATDTSAPGSAGTTPPWVAEAEANIQLPKPEPGKKLTIAEVRAYVAERSKPENRAKIRAILKRFGVAKLTELPEDKYEVMMEEVAKL